jgi:hypothetical protein
MGRLDVLERNSEEDSFLSARDYASEKQLLLQQIAAIELQIESLFVIFDYPVESSSSSGMGKGVKVLKCLGIDDNVTKKFAERLNAQKKELSALVSELQEESNLLGLKDEVPLAKWVQKVAEHDDAVFARKRTVHKVSTIQGASSDEQRETLSKAFLKPSPPAANSIVHRAVLYTSDAIIRPRSGSSMSRYASAAARYLFDSKGEKRVETLERLFFEKPEVEPQEPAFSSFYHLSTHRTIRSAIHSNHAKH